MSTYELKAAAERLLDSHEGIGNGTECDYEAGGYAAEDAIAVARAYLAGGWRDDFENCPRDRMVEFWMEHQNYALTGFYGSKRALGATHWREFIPPTKGVQ